MKFRYSLAVLSAGFLVACGGGSSGSGKASVSGNVVDDALVGSIICLDSNDNGKCDSGEPSTTSGKGGAFTLKYDKGTKGNILAYGGKFEKADGSLGEEFKGVLKGSLAYAKKGKSNITPATTLAVELEKQGIAKTPEVAKVMAARELGLEDVNEIKQESFDKFVAKTKDTEGKLDVGSFVKKHKEDLKKRSDIKLGFKNGDVFYDYEVDEESSGYEIEEDKAVLPNSFAEYIYSPSENKWKLDDDTADVFLKSNGEWVTEKSKLVNGTIVSNVDGNVIMLEAKDLEGVSEAKYVYNPKGHDNDEVKSLDVNFPKGSKMYKVVRKASGKVYGLVKKHYTDLNGYTSVDDLKKKVCEEQKKVPGWSFNGTQFDDASCADEDATSGDIKADWSFGSQKDGTWKFENFGDTKVLIFKVDGEENVFANKDGKVVQLWVDDEEEQYFYLYNEAAKNAVRKALVEKYGN